MAVPRWKGTEKRRMKVLRIEGLRMCYVYMFDVIVGKARTFS